MFSPSAVFFSQDNAPEILRDSKPAVDSGTQQLKLSNEKQPAIADSLVAKKLIYEQW